MKNEQRNGLPLEVQEAALKEQIGKIYPLLYSDRFMLVDTKTTRLAIDDVSYLVQEPIAEDIDTLMLSCRGWVEVYDAENLSLKLDAKLQRLLAALNKNRCIIIFPGNGAKTVKDLLPEKTIQEASIIELPTERIVGKNGEVEKVSVMETAKARKIISNAKTETIIVLDDVIVTGSTLSAIKAAIPGRNIEWYAGSLFMRSPIQRGKGTNAQSGIDGYTAIITPVLYQGTTGTPPLNSLSTLIGTSEKSSIVRNRYIESYVEDKETFLQTVKALQKKINL